MSEVPVRPASTVVLLRDGSDELELLLVRRNRALAFAGGFWVFPGGAVDDDDRTRAGGDPDAAARVAAAREAGEEAGLHPDPDGMVLISHWTTPVEERKRFSTWFYAGSVAYDAPVTIDGSEIHDYRWIGVQTALKEHADGSLNLMPPTFVTLLALSRYRTAEEALAGERNTPCPRVLPVLFASDSNFVTVYPGDVAYEGGDPEAEGPRHRSFMVDGSWRYQYQGVEGAIPLFPQD